MVGRILIFLVSTAVDFLCFLLLARLLMQLFRVSFANPIGEFVVALTNWLVRPLRRVIPGIFGIDLASLLPAWLLQVVLLAFVAWLRLPAGGFDGGLLAALFFFGLLETVKVAIYVLIVALIAGAVISWVNPYSPMAGPVLQLTRPLLRPVQRFVPPVGNIDLSPLIVIVVLQVLLMILSGIGGPGGTGRW